MKTYLIAAFLALSNAHAISTQWAEDSATSFDLTILGTGVAWSDTIVSPSGLWSMGALIKAVPGYGIYNDSPRYEFGDWGTMTFLGHPDHPILVADQYSDVKAVLEQGEIFDSNHFNEVRPGTWGMLQDDGTVIPGGYLEAWSGRLPMTIETIDALDPSTWSWSLHIFAHGPEYARQVPEGGGIVCLAFAAGLLLFFRPRKEKAWTN